MTSGDVSWFTQLSLSILVMIIALCFVKIGDVFDCKKV